jgi:hypothetical protein
MPATEKGSFAGKVAFVTGAADKLVHDTAKEEQHEPPKR